MTANNTLFHILDQYLNNGLHQLDASTISDEVYSVSARSEGPTVTVGELEQQHFEFARANISALTNISIQHGSELASEILAVFDDYDLGLAEIADAAQSVSAKLGDLFQSSLGKGLSKKFELEHGTILQSPGTKSSPDMSIPSPNLTPQMTML